MSCYLILKYPNNHEGKDDLDKNKKTDQPCSPETPIELAVDFILHDFEMAEVEPISTYVDFGEKEFLVADERGYEHLLYKMAENFLFTSDGRLVITPSGFLEIIIEHTCESALPPEQLTGCGMDSVLLYWNDMLLMVGVGGSVQYSYDEPLFIIPECDAARILSNTSMKILQRVPDSTISIFKIGSTEPAALLYDALDYFDQRSAKADENLSVICSALPGAVEACIDAARQECSISQRRKLLRAGSYGQAFVSQFQRDRAQEMSKTLRVLNAVCNQEIGICLSIQTYKLLTPSVLIVRLINTHHHLLVLRISEYLGLDQEVVSMHWACLKITTSSAISDKNGRRKLAAMLVENEPRSSKQVPLLLSIGEEDAALKKATEYGDTGFAGQLNLTFLGVVTWGLFLKYSIFKIRFFHKKSIF